MAVPVAHRMTWGEDDVVEGDGSANAELAAIHLWEFPLPPHGGCSAEWSAEWAEDNRSMNMYRGEAE